MNSRIDLEGMLIRRPAATFMVRVSGDSMTDADIHEGDTLIVDRSIEPRDGLVIVAVVDGEMTVKRLRLNAGAPRLMAESGGFEVWGVVTYCIRPLA